MKRSEVKKIIIVMVVVTGLQDGGGHIYTCYKWGT